MIRKHKMELPPLDEGFGWRMCVREKKEVCKQIDHSYSRKVLMVLISYRDQKVTSPTADIHEDTHEKEREK